MKSRPNEFELIAKYFAPLAGEGAFDLQDDAALLAVPEGKQLVITQDALAAGVHFFADDLPRLIAKKALRVNLSDIASKGARPFAYSIALGLSDDWNEKWVAAFARGLAEDQDGFDVSLTGGDTFLSPGGTTIAITAFGLISPDKYKSRLGAQLGDALFVTGTIGDAALGLKQRLGKIDSRLLAKHEKNYLIDSYLLPQPVTILSDIIGEFATASMDISDGLVGDLEKLCQASDAGATIYADSVPMSGPARKVIKAMPHHLETALTGGDDYELLFTVPLESLEAFKHATHLLPVSIFQIGVVEPAEKGVVVLNGEGHPLTFEANAYRHF